MKTTDTHVYFYSGGEIYSNWHSTPKQFIDPLLGDAPFDSTEQAFMMYKALFFGDKESAQIIAMETDPSMVKSLGRQVKNFDEYAWDCVALGYMTYVNYLKFSQNPEFEKQILQTGNRILVEASRRDKIWGVGWYESDPEILDERNWLGRNLLGVALMNVRRLLIQKRDKKDPSYKPSYPHTQDLLRKIS